MIKDYWIYQKANVTTPWALYVIKEYEPRKGKKFITLDYTLYHENIPNNTHSKSFIGLHCDTIGEYAKKIMKEMSRFVPITEQDEKQILFEIEQILFY